MFLQLYHGRQLDPVTREQPEMDDWGPTGPVFECDFVRSDYTSHLRLSRKHCNDQFLSYVGDLLYYDERFYGAYQVCVDLPEDGQYQNFELQKADPKNWRQWWTVKREDRHGDLYLTHDSLEGRFTAFSGDEDVAARFTKAGAEKWIKDNVGLRNEYSVVEVGDSTFGLPGDPWRILLGDLQAKKDEIQAVLVCRKPIEPSEKLQLEAKLAALHTARELAILRMPKKETS